MEILNFLILKRAVSEFVTFLNLCFGITGWQRTRAHLQLLHGDDAVVVGVDDLLELLPPVPHPVIVDVLSLLVLHRAHGQGDEL